MVEAIYATPNPRKSCLYRGSSVGLLPVHELGFVLGLNCSIGVVN